MSMSDKWNTDYIGTWRQESSSLSLLYYLIPLCTPFLSLSLLALSFWLFINELSMQKIVDLIFWICLFSPEQSTCGLVTVVLYRISSLMPLLARKVFMEFQDVSWTPIRRRTPSRISRITSGGARRDLMIEDCDKHLHAHTVITVPVHTMSRGYGP